MGHIRILMMRQTLYVVLAVVVVLCVLMTVPANVQNVKVLIIWKVLPVKIIVLLENGRTRTVVKEYALFVM